VKKIATLLLIVFFGVMLAACVGRDTTPPAIPETPPVEVPPATEPAGQTQWPDLELGITTLHGGSALPAGILHEIDYLPGSIGDRVMIQTNVPLRDFALITFTVDMDEYELWYIPENTYGMVAEFSPGDAFIINRYMGMGTLPRSGVTFIDQYGERRYFAIQHDHSLGLEPSPYMPDFLDLVVDGRVRIDATTGGGSAWDLGYFDVDVNDFDPDRWFIQNRYRWAEHEMVIWELHNIRPEQQSA